MIPTTLLVPRNDSIYMQIYSIRSTMSLISGYSFSQLFASESSILNIKIK